MERFEFKQGTCLTKGTERRGVKGVPQGVLTMTWHDHVNVRNVWVGFPGFW